MNLVTSLHEGVSDELAIKGEDIIQVVRLGKTTDRQSTKPRPLKVKFKKNEKKNQIWKTARNLNDAKDAFEWKKKIRISHDYTVKQREKQQELWNEL